MASIRHLPERRKPWIVDYRDLTGKRRGPSFRTRQEAQDFLPIALMAEQRRKWAYGRRIDSPFPPDVTVEQYARHWLTTALPTLSPQSRASYASVLRTKILPHLGSIALGSLRRVTLKVWIAELLDSGLSRATAAQAASVLRTMLADAIDDSAMPPTPSGAHPPNPADGLAQAMRLGWRDERRNEDG